MATHSVSNWYQGQENQLTCVTHLRNKFIVESIYVVNGAPGKLIWSSIFLHKFTHIQTFIQYFARNWPWYSLRGLHIRITSFSLYGIRISFFLYMVMLPKHLNVTTIVLDRVLLWAAIDAALSQEPLLWRHNDKTVIALRNMRGRERDIRQRLDNANARRLQTVNR